jgi:hypothetical protein
MTKKDLSMIGQETKEAEEQDEEEEEGCRTAVHRPIIIEGDLDSPKKKRKESPVTNKMTPP